MDCSQAESCHGLQLCMLPWQVERDRNILLEAVLLEGHPFYLGVQWHPELLPAQWGVFRLLVEAAASQRAR